MADNFQRTTTSTQIRNMYSDGMAYMNIRFFNTNLSFQLYPFMNKDQNGRSRYNMKAGLSTTVNFEGAYALWKAATDIINGTVTEMNLVIPCANDATITLERKMNQQGEYETLFMISKSNNTVAFKFTVTPIQVKENNQIVTKVMETGLGVFVKTINGYLEGINADRHLDKLTDDFAKLQESKPQGGNGWQQKNGGYQKGNNYQCNNYRGNNNGGGQNGNGWGNPPQSMGNYSLSN